MKKFFLSLLAFLLTFFSITNVYAETSDVVKYRWTTDWSRNYSYASYMNDIIKSDDGFIGVSFFKDGMFSVSKIANNGELIETHNYGYLFGDVRAKRIVRSGNYYYVVCVVGPGNELLIVQLDLDATILDSWTIGSDSRFWEVEVVEKGDYYYLLYFEGDEVYGAIRTNKNFTDDVDLMSSDVARSSLDNEVINLYLNNVIDSWYDFIVPYRDGVIYPTDFYTSSGVYMGNKIVYSVDGDVVNSKNFNNGWIHDGITYNGYIYLLVLYDISDYSVSSIDDGDEGDNEEEGSPEEYYIPYLEVLDSSFKSVYSEDLSQYFDDYTQFEHIRLVEDGFFLTGMHAEYFGYDSEESPPEEGGEEETSGMVMSSPHGERVAGSLPNSVNAAPPEMPNGEPPQIPSVDSSSQIGDSNIYESGEEPIAGGSEDATGDNGAIAFAMYYSFVYNISSITDGNGTVSVSSQSCNGEEVTFVVSPKFGYVLDSVKVTDSDGNVLEFTDYTFTMPRKDVVIEASFSRLINPQTGGIMGAILILLVVVVGAVTYYIHKSNKNLSKV